MNMVILQGRFQLSLPGFTLTEVLVALTILAEIAVFALPKILNSQQNTAYNAAAKETIAMVSEAYHVYRLRNGASTAIGMQDLTPYMNYVKFDGSGRDFDNVQGLGTMACNGSSGACLFLHNGGLIKYFNVDTFGGTATTNCIWFVFDPDGKVTDGTTNGPGKSVWMALYYNERIASYATLPAGVQSSSATIARMRCETCDPPWFSW